MQPIEIIGIIIEIQFSCQLQKIWASGQSKTLGPTKRRLKNGETSDYKNTILYYTFALKLYLLITHIAGIMIRIIRQFVFNVIIFTAIKTCIKSFVLESDKYLQTVSADGFLRITYSLISTQVVHKECVGNKGEYYLLEKGESLGAD